MNVAYNKTDIPLSTLVVTVLSTAFLTTVTAENLWTAEPFNPDSVPLAVRSPYLSCWLGQGNGTALNAGWPKFWTGSILGWAGYVTVDGTPYNFLGTPSVPSTIAKLAVQKSLKFTSTQSTFVMTAGPVDLTVNFLSPVEPTDLIKQSFPFSYLSLSAASNDGGSHKVQVYTDISAEWITGNNSLTANWTTSTGDGVVTHQVQLANQCPFTEVSDHIQQGSAFYSTQSTTGLTFQTGEDIVVRAQFINNSVLLNTQDSQFRAVSDKWPVFALARDLGAVSSSSPSSEVVFSVGHTRDPAVQYIIANGVIQERSSLFWSHFNSIDDAISSFLSDYPSALSRANAFDEKVSKDASAISPDYASIVALSIRQGFAATEITVSKDAEGMFNNSDVMMFLKEISSDGNINTVDVIFPSWPLFLYTNPTLGKQLLLPIFEYQATGQYPNAWSVHDIGMNYPKALGHNDGKDKPMPLEECGNMLIMALSYTQRTNDTSLIKTYFNLLDQWAEILVTETLIPADQFSTDVFAGTLANQTNLAIKGIIGIKAMAVIAEIVGDQAKSSNYSSIATSYVQQWETLATSSGGEHLTLSYGNDTSWGLSYNLLGDKLLGTNLFPSSIYDMQTKWYSGVGNILGVALDTRHTYTSSAWEIWTAGIVSSTAVRDYFISAVKLHISDGLSSVPQGDWYDTVSGNTMPPFAARPVVGGHLALLLVQPPNNQSDNNPPDSKPLPSFTPSSISSSATPSASSDQDGSVSKSSSRRIDTNPVLSSVKSLIGPNFVSSYVQIFRFF
ncbi:Glutaminase GtaA [Abortiporus biennis]